MTMMSNSKSSDAAPRKRRKRASGSGASDDCFTCATRGTKCDRRRPYCSQCLEIGKDCSGYKTTLTWGVGVASRGKLRGLSLPVSGGDSSPATQSSSKARKQTSSGNNDSKAPLSPPTPQQPSSEASGQPHQPQAPATSKRPVQRPTVSTSVPPVSQHPPATARHAQPSYHQPSSAPGPTHTPISATYPISPQSMWTPQPSSATTAHHPMGQPYSYGNQMVNGLDTLYAASHAAFSPDQTSGSVPLITPSQQSYNIHVSGSSPVSATHYATHQDPSTMGTNIQSWPSSVPTTYSKFDPLSASESQWTSPVTAKRRADDLGNDYDDDVEDTVYGNEAQADNAVSIAPYSPGSYWFLGGPFATSLPVQLLEKSAGSTPRVRYLISYFSEVIAPVIVAFDSPTNPYRTTIMRLAQESQTLQHAIAALSASNLRQRREGKTLSTERTGPSRMSSRAHRALTDVSFQDRYGIKDPKDPTREELYHKGMAIRSLNAQLADPNQRHQDSVLATLLILCLFHMCETGVAQFHTQFTGVRKLLTMRSRGVGIHSEEAKWCMRMFTWFDAMTASINNREGQLQGTYLDMTCLSDEEWALENLAGCDGRLFKVVARLGRLNILSQNRPVEPAASVGIPSATPTVPPSLSNYQVPDPFMAPNDPTNPYITSPFPEASYDSNPQSEFWREWHAVRQQLESWRLDTTSFVGPDGLNEFTASPSNSCASLSTSSSSFVPTPSSPSSHFLVAEHNFADLANISESFRYSALLYTERLANPDLPSQHPRIQRFVRTALQFIAAVQSDVYLLWPLFITGSECVYDHDREVIRRRCKDIQNDSGFYNNISCLELLEKIWIKNPSVKVDGGSPMGSAGHATGLQDMQYGAASYHGLGLDMLGVNAWGEAQPSGQHERGFKWKSVIESEAVDGEYIVV